LEKRIFVNFFSAKTGRVFPFDFQAQGASEVQKVSRPRRVAANDADSYVAAAAAGMGLTQTPVSTLVCAHLTSGALKQVMQNSVVTPLPIFALYPHNRLLSARIAMSCAVFDQHVDQHELEPSFVLQSVAKARDKCRKRLAWGPTKSFRNQRLNF
jgi:DNA-binding transcriptional LysR family regulator